MTQRSPGLRDGELDRGDQLVGGERRGVEAREELRRRDAPLARWRCARRWSRRAPRSRPAARRPDRRRPASRRWCRGCGWRDGRSAARPRRAAARGGATSSLAPSSAWVVSAPTRIASPAAEMPASSATPRDVDQRAGLGQAEGEGGEQRLPAGQQPGVGAGRAPQLEHIGKRGRPDIGERRRLHGSLLPRRTRSAGILRAVYGPVPPASRARPAHVRQRAP